MAKKDEPEKVYNYIKIHWATKNITAKPMEITTDGSPMSMHTKDYMAYISTMQFKRGKDTEDGKPRLKKITYMYPTINIAYVEAHEEETVDKENDDDS